MKRFVSILTVGLLVSGSAWAGKDPCKGVKVKKDAFGVTRVYDAGDLKLKKTADGKWSLTLEFQAGGGYGYFSSSTSEQIPGGTTVQVMMEDGSTLELTTSGNAGPNTYSIMGVMVTEYGLPFSVTPEQVALLVAQPIKAGRVMQGNDAKLTKEFSKGDTKKFQETGSCMVST